MRTKRLNQVPDVDIFRGFPSARAASDGEVPVQSLASLRGDEPVTRFVRDDEIGERMREIVMPGDLLVGLSGADMCRVLVVPEGTAPFVPSQQVAVVRLGKLSGVDTWYVAAWLSSRQGRQALDGLVRSTASPRITTADLSRLALPIPNMEKQTLVGERYRLFVASIEAHRAILTKTEQLLEVELTLAFVGEDASTADGR